MRLTLALIAAATTAACASGGPEVPAPLRNPTGMYDFTTELEGQTITGTVEITGTEGAYTGWVSTDVTEPIPVTSVTVVENEMTVLAQAPDAPVTMVFTFTGNDFVADWEYAGQVGVARGSKRAGSPS
jgi:hypothetical protein